MRRRAITLAACLWVGGVALGQDAPEGASAKLAGRDPEFLAKVNDAVARGKLWLEGRGKPDGKLHDTLADGAGHGPYPHGPTALACLTLLHAGGTPYEPAVEKGFAYLKDKWDTWVAGGKELHTPTSWKTYEVGLTLMALEARARWRPPALREKPHATDVVGGLKLKPADGEWAKQLRDFLVDTVVAHEKQRRDKTGASLTDRRGDAWSYPMSNPAGDHSNTQYAILGLKSASRMAPATKRADLRPPIEMWIWVLERFLAVQETTGPAIRRVELDRKALKDGYIVTKTTSTVDDRARGWGYNTQAPPAADALSPYQIATGSMTCVGIASVELAWSEIESAARSEFGWPPTAKPLAQAAMRAHSDAYTRAVNDGFAWLAEHFSVEKNPDHDAWHYYYLYGLERAGVLAERDVVGKHDWYREGAALLLAQQQGHGGWHTPSDGTEVATCFALLFLTRATVPVKRATTG